MKQMLGSLAGKILHRSHDGSNDVHYPESTDFSDKAVIQEWLSSLQTHLDHHKEATKDPVEDEATLLCNVVQLVLVELRDQKEANEKLQQKLEQSEEENRQLDEEMDLMQGHLKEIHAAVRILRLGDAWGIDEPPASQPPSQPPSQHGTPRIQVIPAAPNAAPDASHASEGATTPRLTAVEKARSQRLSAANAFDLRSMSEEVSSIDDELAGPPPPERPAWMTEARNTEEARKLQRKASGSADLEDSSDLRVSAISSERHSGARVSPRTGGKREKAMIALKRMSGQVDNIRSKLNQSIKALPKTKALKKKGSRKGRSSIRDYLSPRPANSIPLGDFMTDPIDVESHPNYVVVLEAISGLASPGDIVRLDASVDIESAAEGAEWSGQRVNSEKKGKFPSDSVMLVSRQPTRLPDEPEGGFRESPTFKWDDGEREPRVLTNKFNTLNVTIRSASGLPFLETGKCTYYCQFELNGFLHSTSRVKVPRLGSAPWFEQFSVPVSGAAAMQMQQSIAVHIFHGSSSSSSSSSNASPFGVVEVSLADVHWNDSSWQSDYMQLEVMDAHASSSSGSGSGSDSPVSLAGSLGCPLLGVQLSVTRRKSVSRWVLPEPVISFTVENSAETVRYEITPVLKEDDHQKWADAILAKKGDLPKAASVHIMARYGHSEALRALVASSADAAAALDSFGFTPFHYAVIFGHQKCVAALLDCGASPTATDKYKLNVLHLCCIYDEVALLRYMLTESGAPHQLSFSEVVNAGDHFGRTPLHYASALGHADCVSLLLDNSADTAATDVDGNSPLLHAFLAGKSAVADLLRERGADAPLNKSSVSIPFICLAKEENIIAALFKNRLDSRGNSLLHRVVLLMDASKVLGAVRSLIENHEIDVDAINDDGQTPLMLACVRGLHDTVRYLVERGGVETSPADAHGNNALHYCHRVESAQVLVDQGCSLARRNQDGFTPLHCAYAFGNQALVDLLIAKGASTSSMSKQVPPRSPAASIWRPTKYVIVGVADAPTFVIQ